MRSALRGFALISIFVTTSIAWLVLGVVTSERSNTQSWALRSAVTDLWGADLRIAAPKLTFARIEAQTRTEQVTDDQGRVSTHQITEDVTIRTARAASKTRIRLDVDDDVRRKGLTWFPLYDVALDGSWVYRHEGDKSGWLEIAWSFPQVDGFYDDFELMVDGEVQRPSGERGFAIQQAVVPGQEVLISLRFASRGQESLIFQPSDGVSELEDFELVMSTDFADIDFPGGTLSPSDRSRVGEGWELQWKFERMLTGKDMGVIVPSPVQPGELSSSMSLSAPFSLGLFMVWITALGLLRGIEVHPINHAFLAGAFFSFHLLFAYVVDHMPVEWAFALCSAVSVGLVVSYLRLVVSPRFALVEAGLAQLVYLVGFALAHFWDGMTGLTLTVIGIATLFVLMQLTGRIQWSDALRSGPTLTPSGARS